MFEMDGVSLQIEDDAIEFIVDLAYENQLGARGLRGICESILKRFMYEIPSDSRKNKKIKITEKMARDEWEAIQNLKYAS